MEKTLHTDAILQQIADTTRNASLAAGAAEEEAYADGATTLDMARAEHLAPMQT